MKDIRSLAGLSVLGPEAEFYLSSREFETFIQRALQTGQFFEATQSAEHQAIKEIAGTIFSLADGHDEFSLSSSLEEIRRAQESIRSNPSLNAETSLRMLEVLTRIEDGIGELAPHAAECRDDPKAFIFKHTKLQVSGPVRCETTPYAVVIYLHQKDYSFIDNSTVENVSSAGKALIWESLPVGLRGRLIFINEGKNGEKDPVEIEVTREHEVLHSIFDMVHGAPEPSVYDSDLYQYCLDTTDLTTLSGHNDFSRKLYDRAINNAWSECLSYFGTGDGASSLSALGGSPIRSNLDVVASAMWKSEKLLSQQKQTIFSCYAERYSRYLELVRSHQAALTRLDEIPEELLSRDEKKFLMLLWGPEDTARLDPFLVYDGSAAEGAELVLRSVTKGVEDALRGQDNSVLDRATDRATRFYPSEAVESLVEIASSSNHREAVYDAVVATELALMVDGYRLKGEQRQDIIAKLGRFEGKRMEDKWVSTQDRALAIISLLRRPECPYGLDFENDPPYSIQESSALTAQVEVFRISWMARFPGAYESIGRIDSEQVRELVKEMPVRDAAASQAFPYSGGTALLADDDYKGVADYVCKTTYMKDALFFTKRLRELLEENSDRAIMAEVKEILNKGLLKGFPWYWEGSRELEDLGVLLEEINKIP